MTKKKSLPSVTISGNEFCAVKWDATAVEAVKTVAEGLRVNAQALCNLSELFKSQNVQIETMLKIGDDK